MTAIAWAIFIFTMINDPTLKDATDPAKNLAYGLSTFGLLCMIILIKDILK